MDLIRDLLDAWREWALFVLFVSVPFFILATAVDVIIGWVWNKLADWKYRRFPSKKQLQRAEASKQFWKERRKKQKEIDLNRDPNIPF